MDTVKVYQSKVINSVLRLDTRKMEPDSRGVYIVEEAPYSFEAIFEETNEEFVFSINAQRLLLYILFIYARDRSETVVFYITEYMQMCSLNNYNSTRKEVNSNLSAMEILEYYFNGAYGRIIRKFSIRNGTVMIELDSSFLDELKRETFVSLPAAFFKIDIRRNKSASHFLWYMLVLQYLNTKKSNRNRVSIKSLLGYERFPTMEDIKKTANQSVSERIYKPLFKNLAVVNRIIPLRFFFEQKELTWDEVQRLRYYQLIRVVVHYK